MPLWRSRRRCRMPSKIPPGESRGWIVPIGGAENKENDRHILERFVRVSGGADADIVVIPTASRMHETGARYEELFSDLGATRVTVMDFDTRRDCQETGRLRRLEAATGIFFTGGNQLRLTTLLGGTPVAKLIRVRRRGFLRHLGQRAPRAGPRPHESLHHRSALPAARPPGAFDYGAGL